MEKINLETTSVWCFPTRGSWANHEGSYRGNWSPYIPRNLILRYSDKGDLVLDQFVGGGTTAIEAGLLKRNFIGIDINRKAVELTKRNVSELGLSNTSKIYLMDAKKLEFLENSSIDLICTHPPYSSIIKYSESIKEDISLLDINDFYIAMQKVARESYRVLKKNKVAAFLMADIRKNGMIVPLAFRTMEIFLEAGFKLKEIVIKEQHNCKSTGYWKDKAKEMNFLLIAHEYLFILKK